MLLAKTQVQDKSGAILDCRRLSIPDGNGQAKTVELTGPAAHRYDQIDRAMRSFGHIFDDQPRSAFDSTDPLSWNISQLAYTETTMLQRFRVPVIYKDIVPVSYSAPAWAETVEAEEFDNVGVAEMSANNSTDMPLADAKFNRRLIEVKGGKIGYHYDVQELIASQQLKRPLSDIRMKSAMLAAERFLQRVAFRGDSAKSITGFWNSARVTPVAASTGAWDSSSTSAVAILKDINTAITAVYQNSGTNALVTDIALPIEALGALNNTILSANSGGVVVPVAMSLLAYIKANNMSKLMGNIDIKFHGIPSDPDDSSAGSSLNTAGTLAHDGTTPKTTSRVVYYAKDEQYIVMHQPLPLTFLAPQPRGTDVMIPGRFRFTPVDVRYPKTVYYQDCVLAADVA